MNLLLVAVFLGNLTITAYRSVPEQTDDSPFITSIGERVCKDGVAVSQDLLKSKKVKYGDWIYIEGVGLKRINDTMHSRHKNHIDVWLPTLGAEKRFHRRFKSRKVNVWIVNFKEEKSK
jgi:3D (Asp-Asp-Asp) domain-containing protein